MSALSWLPEGGGAGSPDGNENQLRQFRQLAQFMQRLPLTLHSQAVVWLLVDVEMHMACLVQLQHLPPSIRRRRVFGSDVVKLKVGLQTLLVCGSKFSSNPQLGIVTPRVALEALAAALTMEVLDLPWLNLDFECR